MTKCFLMSICAFAIMAQSHAQQTARTTTNGTGYLEYLPPDYATNTTKKYPVLIFLHGLGERGNGSVADLQKIKSNGPPKLIQAGNTMCFMVNGVQECFIVISPQLGSGYGGWWANVLQPIFDYVLNGPQNYRIDKSRVYLTGLSLGGQGVYIGLGETTDIFAAGVVIAGFNNGNGCTISSRKIPVWGFHGESDGTIPYANGLAEFNLIGACTSPAPTAQLKWTNYPGVGHNSWDKAYTTDHSVQSPLNVYEWLLSKKKSIGNSTPLANAGADQVITLPTNSLSISGSGSDTDGTISSYAWTQVSGAATTLTNANTNAIGVAGLAAGSYVFRLTVTDNLGASATDDVNLNVNAAVAVSSATNLALGRPTVVSSYQYGSLGGDKAVDGNTATRWSSQYSDAQWIYVDLGSIVNINRVKITWEVALASSYKIQTSTDAVTWNDLNSITNNTASTNDQTGLNGSGRYVRMLGLTRRTPYGYSIYEFEVYGSAVNNKAATNSSPLANAGADQVITLPTNSLSISGSGSDTDGTISSYAWTQVSGAATTLTNANTNAIGVAGLAAGSYVFRLTVTDNLGASATDDVNLNVNAAVAVSSATNLALGRPTVVSSYQYGSLGGDKAVDGNTATRWSSQYSDAQWIYVDLGSIVNINRVKITWEVALASSYKIQTSTDAVTWNDLNSITNNTASTNDQTGLNGSGRYVRMLGLTRGTPYGYSIYEFEVYGNFASSTSAGARASTTSETSAVEDPVGLAFLDKTYLGIADYSVVIFTSDGTNIFNGKWNADLYRDIFLTEGLYIYQVLKNGNRIDSGKLMITK